MAEHHAAESDRAGVIGWIVRHPKTSIAACVVLLLIGVTLLFHRAAENRLQRRIDAIRARGEPVTVEEINASLPDLPPDENMALVLLDRARPMVELDIPAEKAEHLPLLGRAGRLPTGVALPLEQVEAMRWYLSQFREELAGIHEALHLPHTALEITWSTPTMTWHILGLTDLRKVSRILVLEALSSAENEDRTATEAAVHRCLRIRRALNSDGSVLFAGLIQIAMDAQAFDTIERVVNRVGLRAEVLRQLQGELHEIETQSFFCRAMIGERAIMLDARGPMGGGGGGIPVIPILSTMELSAILQVFELLIDATREPSSESRRRRDEAKQLIDDLPTIYVLTKIAVQPMPSTVDSWLRSIAANRSLQVALAAERYRLDHNGWPEALSDLVPDYLAFAPIDPFDDRPIRYAIIPEGIKVWSVGDNRQDNGGDVMRLTPETSRARATDIGWVILNPELRGRPAEETEDSVTAYGEVSDGVDESD